ncbi:MAG TPA: hypothetical protein VFO62_05920 [Candidatus Binatia bacterium]|nr:hypothetical protein [Candidatus Binatia bacterium]
MSGCFVLGNGPSLTENPAEKIATRTVIGTNRSFEYVPSNYHVVIDQKCFEDYGDKLARMEPARLFAPPGSPFGRQPEHLGRRRGCPEFSWSLNCVHWRFAPYAAIQIAVALGFSTIVLLGVDLCEHEGRGHFFDKPMGLELEPFQREAFGYIAGVARVSGDFDVFTCSSITKLRAFPRISFERALELTA